MKRAERAERLINHEKGHYEMAMNGPTALSGRLTKAVLANHWVDVVQTVAVGCQSSELRVRESCRDALEDTVKDDVELGVKIGLALKPGEECFSATITDADDRDLHFFFTARSEDEVVERLVEAFNKGKS